MFASCVNFLLCIRECSKYAHPAAFAEGTGKDPPVPFLWRMINMDEEKIYHTFPKSDGIKLRDLLPMVRSAGYSNYDELSMPVIICPECEEWTWVEFNSVSCCILDLLGDLTVESIDVDDNKLKLWIKPDEYNWFKPKEEEA